MKLLYFILGFLLLPSLSSARQISEYKNYYAFHDPLIEDMYFFSKENDCGVVIHVEDQLVNAVSFYTGINLIDYTTVDWVVGRINSDSFYLAFDYMNKKFKTRHILIETGNVYQYLYSGFFLETPLCTKLTRVDSEDFPHGQKKF